MDNIDQSQTNDPSAFRAPPPDGAAPSESTTPALPDAGSSAPQQAASPEAVIAQAGDGGAPDAFRSEAAAQPVAASGDGGAADAAGAATQTMTAAAETAVETVVSVAGVAATSMAGTVAAAATHEIDTLLNPGPLGPEPPMGDPEFVRERLHAIELHALRWGGEVGANIRNEVTALMDHMGVPRQN